MENLLKEKIVVARNKFTMKNIEIYRKMISYLIIKTKKANCELIRSNDISVTEKLAIFLKKKINHRFTMRLASFIRLGSKETCVAFVVQALNNVGEKYDNSIIEISKLKLALEENEFKKILNNNDIKNGDIVLEEKHAYIFIEWVKNKEIARVIDNQPFNDKDIDGTIILYTKGALYCLKYALKSMLISIIFIFLPTKNYLWLYIGANIFCIKYILYNKVPKKRKHKFDIRSEVYRK